MQLQQQALEAAKQALIGHGDECTEVNGALILIDRALAEQPAQKCSYPYCGCNSKAWCKVERNEALDKKAENARELELDYEPAQQEPVAWMELLREARDNCKASIVEEGISASRKEYRIDLEARLTAALNTSPPAQRTWTQEHWTEYERSIVEAEREACAKVCEERIEFWQRDDGRRYEDEYCANAIRARSNT